MKFKKFLNSFLFFLLGAGIVYFIDSSQILRMKRDISNILVVGRRLFDIDSQMMSTVESRDKTLTDCLSEETRCNFSETSKQLQALDSRYDNLKQPRQYLINSVDSSTADFWKKNP